MWKHCPFHRSVNREDHSVQGGRGEAQSTEGQGGGRRGVLVMVAAGPHLCGDLELFVLLEQLLCVLDAGTSGRVCGQVELPIVVDPLQCLRGLCG